MQALSLKQNIDRHPNQPTPQTFPKLLSTRSLITFDFKPYTPQNPTTPHTSPTGGGLGGVILDHGPLGAASGAPDRKWSGAPRAPTWSRIGVGFRVRGFCVRGLL